MKKLVLFCLLFIGVGEAVAQPKTGGPLYVSGLIYQLVVVKKCNGLDTWATYNFRSFNRAKRYRAVFQKTREYTRVYIRTIESKR